MSATQSLVVRIAVGKLVGLVFGVVGFIILPEFLPEAGWQMKWGVLLWYTTLGAIVGVFGVFDRHPVLYFPMPWYVRAPIIGAWMNFVLMLFTFDTMKNGLSMAFGTGSTLSSPFWVVVEGAVVAAVIGFLATRFGGEGPAAASQ